MINTSQKLIALLSGAALLSVSSLAAQTATTAPVGYVSVDVNANADLKRGVPFSQAASFAAAADSVLAGTVTVQSTVPDLTTESHFLSVTSGTLIGKWYEVTGSTASSVTVAEDLQAAGLAASDTFTVVPFWTLDGLFPNGGDIPQSSDVFSPVAFILVNDVTQLGTNLAAGSLYFYHDGTQGPAGWYDNDNLGAGVVGSSVLTPASYITIRNGTGSPITVTMSGTVPEQTVTNEIVSRSAGPQDSQVLNPFPAGITLAGSNLFEDGVIRGSSDVFAPVDLLLIFEGTPTGINPAASKVVFYHDGTQGPAGWYDNDNLGGGTIDAFELPLASALIVRRAVGTDELISWSPTIPYSL